MGMREPTLIGQVIPFNSTVFCLDAQDGHQLSHPSYDIPPSGVFMGILKESDHGNQLKSLLKERVRDWWVSTFNAVINRLIHVMLIN